LEDTIDQERHDREQVEAIRRGLEKQLRDRMRSELVVAPSSPNLAQSYGINLPNMSNPSMPTFQNLDQEIRQLKDQLVHEEGQNKKLMKEKKELEKLQIIAEDKILDKDFEISKMERRIKLLEEENRDFKDQINDTTMANEFRDYKTAKEKEIETLKTSWLTTKGVLDNSNDTLQRQLNETKQELEKEQGESEGLRGKNKKIDLQFRQLNRLLDEKSAELLRLEKQQKKDEKELQELRIQLQEASSKSTNKEKMDEMFQQKLSELQIRLDSESNEKRKFEKEFNLLRSQLEEANQMLVQFQEQSTKLTTTNKRLKKRT